ncbi:MAG: hypothetical protein FWF72_00435, partial [Paludibacter sp.]|nr:hypothetical protein [Paludibacter sp.]
MTKKIILFGIFTIIMSGAAMNAQVGINTENPSENAILDMKINSGYPKTVIPPVFTTGDRNGILPNMDLDNGMFFFNTSTGCFNYYVVESAMWLSLCGTMPPAQGMITDCDHIFVRGQYIEGTSLTNNNYISVPVAVTSPGTYVITATTENQPDNGYFFSASGTFTSVGNYVVNLVSAGTPIVAQTDNIKITFNGTIQGCNTPLVVTPAQPDYCINNVIVSPEFYTVGEDLNVPSTHFIQAQLQVYRPGQWQLVANTVNGYFFSGSGQINEGSGYNPNGGFPQLVTVIVPASGNVTAYGTGTDLFTLTNIGSASSCNYPFSVKLATVALSIACEDIDLSSLGTLKMNTQPAGSSVINVRINCTAPGPTILSATFAGLSYTSMVDPTNPSAGNRINIPLGQSIITLYPISTTQKPAVSGDILVTIKSSEGGLKYNCPTTTAHIDPSIAAFTSITAGNGTYMLDPLSGNTPCNITVSASTNVGGTYTITTDNVNGVTFSASSTAVLGSNTITLTPSGTPVKNGTYTYTL